VEFEADSTNDEAAIGCFAMIASAEDVIYEEWLGTTARERMGWE
jgi:hypothetical protein